MRAIGLRLIFGIALVAGCGTSVRGGDCDDTNASRNPGVPDDCGTALGVDDDCDVSVDEDVAPRTFYVDRDGDGRGTDELASVTTLRDGSIAMVVSNRILRIEATGRTSVLVGGGSSPFSEGARGTSISFDSNGARIAADPTRDRLYYEETPPGPFYGGGCIIRYLDLVTGTVHHFAGSGTCEHGPEGGLAATANLPYTGDLAVSDTA